MYVLQSLIVKFVYIVAFFLSLRVAYLEVITVTSSLFTLKATNDYGKKSPSILSAKQFYLP